MIITKIIKCLHGNGNQYGDIMMLYLLQLPLQFNRYRHRHHRRRQGQHQIMRNWDDVCFAIFVIRFCSLIQCVRHVTSIEGLAYSLSIRFCLIVPCLSIASDNSRKLVCHV